MTKRDSVEKSPPWLIPLFAFIAGCAVAAGALSPSISAPDYLRGKADGESKMRGEVYADFARVQHQARYQGARAGWNAHAAGKPFPMQEPKK